MKFFEDSTQIFDHQLDELFSRKKDTELDILLKTLSLVIYQNSNNTDIVELYNSLDLKSFIKVIELFDGRTIKLPSSKDFKEYLILCLVYYYKEVKQEDWNKIKSRFPFEISGISYGIKLKQLTNFIQQKMDEMLRRIEGENIKKDE